MNDFEGLLSSDFGFKPQGKSAPMSSSKPPSSNPSTATSLNLDLGSRTSSSLSDSIFNSKPSQNSGTLDDFGDIFSAPAGRVGKSGSARTDPSFDFEPMFNSSSKSSSAPVYDKPLYDDDIFEGVPGIKSSGASGVKYDNVFQSIPSTSPRSGRGAASSGLDDLLGGLGSRESRQPKSRKEDRFTPAFDDLIPGFGGSSPAERSIPKSTWSSESLATSHKTMEDRFAAPRSASPPAVSSSGVTIDPFEELSVFSKSGSTKADVPSVPSRVDDLDSFDGLGKYIPPSSPDDTIKGKDRNSLGTDHSYINSQQHNDREHSDLISQKTVPVNDDLESNQNVFHLSSPAGSFSASIHSHEKPGSHEANAPAETSSGYEEDIDTCDTVWLTVSEIPLFTQPTRAPPPSRPPPPRPARARKVGSSSFGSKSATEVIEFSPFANSTKHFDGADLDQKARTATIDELGDFAMGSIGNNFDEHVNWAPGEEMDMKSDAAASAAAMKEAMDRAEAKFRQAKEVRERENSKASRIRESVQLEKDQNWLDAGERALREKQERLELESLRRDREEKEREQRRLEKEREREEREREQQRLEKERARAREIERERARQAVERASREARERAAAEARLKAERAAVEKASAEARERAERAAVLRVQAEARERAAAEARERAERAAAEAKEKEVRERAAEARARAEKAERAAAEAREKEAREHAAEARRRAERAAVARAAAGARERAAAEARERAAASARAKQQSSDNDLESFFGYGRASAPRPGANYSDPVFDTEFPSRKGPEVARTSDSNPSMKKASSSANIVDDLSSIFGGVATSGEFQEVEGESEERRRARLERHQRTQERAAKALAEKNQRDLQAQREQAERHRISESLDVEIKRWAAGKEGNLRALLSTLQYVLWPECGWQPVSLTDLITAAAVKKVYRKATLCIHPDKVQQKGANLQQKYVAEKVFDLLKEAWNKFNSEELF